MKVHIRESCYPQRNSSYDENNIFEYKSNFEKHSGIRRHSRLSITRVRPFDYILTNCNKVIKIKVQYVYGRKDLRA